MKIFRLVGKHIWPDAPTQGTSRGHTLQVVILALSLILISAPRCHGLQFDVTYDLTALAAVPLPHPPFAIGFDWSEGGNLLNTLTVSDLRWGAGGGAIGEPLYGPGNGNLTDGLVFHEHALFWQTFQPSATDPLRFHLSLTEHQQDSLDDIIFTIDALSFLCLDCGSFLHLNKRFERPRLGESIWEFTYGPILPPGLTESLPSPVITNVITNVTTPEPSTIGLCMIGIVGVLLMQRRRVPRKTISSSS